MIIGKYMKIGKYYKHYLDGLESGWIIIKPIEKMLHGFNCKIIRYEVLGHLSTFFKNNKTCFMSDHYYVIELKDHEIVLECLR